MKMKNNFEIKTLKDVCKSISDGDWIESKDQSKEGIRLIQTGNVGEGIFKDRVEKARYISESTFKRLNCTEIYEGDCLVSRLPEPVGRACLLPKLSERLITAVDCSILRFNSQLIPKFFIYFSQSRQYLNEVENNCSGATRKRISRKNLSDLEIPVPSLEEQKRLVKILDEKFGAIEELQKVTHQQIADAKELFESRLEETFLGDSGWLDCTLNDVCKFENGDRGKNYPARSKLHLEGFPFVNAGNLKGWREIDLDGKNFLSEKQFNLLGNGKFTIGDILFCLRGSLGKNALVTNIEKGAIASSLVIIRPLEQLDKDFLLYYLNSRLCKEMIIKFAAGAAQPNLGAKDLKLFQIKVPNLKAQKLIVKELDELSKKTKELEVIFRRKITDLDELKKSYLEQAFSGKL